MTWIVTYPDGTTERVEGEYMVPRDGVLYLEDRVGTLRAWSLTAIRSWVAVR